MPECTILAGPNGSGKSSIYGKLAPPGVFINADDIAKQLPEELEEGARKVRAGRVAVEKIDEAIASRSDFCFETTLSSKHALNVMRRAREAGFNIGLVYVILSTPQQNVDRVRFRVKAGGHDIPERDILRRYDASLRHLPAALRMAHEYVVIDNSEAEPIFMFEARPNHFLDIKYYNPAVSLHMSLLNTVRLCTPIG